MALIDCNFRSDSLGMDTSMRLILPQPAATAAPRARRPTLFLLHGLSDDHTAWTHRTAIERYVEPLDLAVVMPNVRRSFWDRMIRRVLAWLPLPATEPARRTAGRCVGGIPCG